MKKIFYVLPLSLLLCACPPDDNSPQYSSYEPLVMKRADFENTIQFQQAHSLQNIAKMYTFGDMIFITERYQGVHLIDNSDPKNPVNKGFIRVLGCVDVAYKSSTLYVSSATDLVAIDVTDYQKPKEIGRQRNIFPQLKDPDDLQVGDGRTFPENSVIIDWIKTTK